MDDAHPGATSTAAVHCEQLVVRYGATTAVDRLSFTAASGEVVALLGPNGAGKTSTMETLEGYRRPDAGRVRVLGHDPVGGRAQVVPRIGVMLQKGGVYPMLGPARVLSLFAAYYDDPEDPTALLDLVGLRGVARTPWRRLSGGEQQRLSLALALVGRPSVVFLDEPTAGVDPEGRLAVRDVIAGLRERGVCVLLTTHELAEAEVLADRVVIIDRGRALAEGTPAELAASTADGAVRFSTAPGLDTAALAGAVGAGTTVTEERPGNYRLQPPAGRPVPEVLAALTTWLAAEGRTLDGLRTGQSLEETYLAITAAAAASSTAAGEPEGGGDGGDDEGGRGRGPRGRRPRRGRARP